MVQHADIDHTGLTGVGGSATVLQNEIQNFPSLADSDNAQPEWWEESAGTATLTEVDVTGESITETWDRCLKVVTTADVYAYQRYTYADEQRLKVGKVVSCRVAVWSVSGVTARVRIQDSGGSLGVATTTAAAWTILTVEGVTLTGTYVDLRLEVNNGTAYFVPLAFGIGATAQVELGPRAIRMRPKIDPSVIRTLTGSSGEAGSYTTEDVTAATSPLACFALVKPNIEQSASSTDFMVLLRTTGSSDTGGATERANAVDEKSERGMAEYTIWLSDTQTFQSVLNRRSGSGTLGFGVIYLMGWWEWA